MDMFADIWTFITGIPWWVYLAAGLAAIVGGWFGGQRKNDQGIRGDNALAWTLWVITPGFLLAVIGLFRGLPAFLATFTGAP